MDCWILFEPKGERQEARGNGRSLLIIWRIFSKDWFVVQHWGSSYRVDMKYLRSIQGVSVELT